jgi:hypothetical protein
MSIQDRMEQFELFILNSDNQKDLEVTMKKYKVYVDSTYENLLKHGVKAGLISESVIEEISDISSYSRLKLKLGECNNNYKKTNLIWKLLTALIGIANPILILGLPVELPALLVFLLAIALVYMAISTLFLLIDETSEDANYWSLIHRFLYFTIFKWYFKSQAKKILLRDFATMRIKEGEI